ncbi:ABC transporter G family member 24-like [Dorcoceras hygrometricum]|uniref:ABC transporter G family member 24-like n=1 Tax=Dorcoceras hygrometricum TaxID=472368 RepID=A0A2Z7D2D8_9LAMI|nr:ABC transporter G family member 24-like [Dorcoceras hygrometricum]
MNFARDKRGAIAPHRAPSSAHIGRPATSLLARPAARGMRNQCARGWYPGRHHARSGDPQSTAQGATSAPFVGAIPCARSSDPRPFSHGFHAQRVAQQIALIGGQHTRRAQPSARAICAGEGAAAQSGGRWPIHEIFFLFNLKFEILDTIMATIVLKDQSLCSDTTVGKAVAIRIPSPGDAAEV